MILIDVTDFAKLGRNSNGSLNGNKVYSLVLTLIAVANTVKQLKKRKC